VSADADYLRIVARAFDAKPSGSTDAPSLGERLQSIALRLELAERERDAYAELAANKCVLQKVTDLIGQQTLCSSAEYQRLKEAERQRDELLVKVSHA
jgi:hypothetical protein